MTIVDNATLEWAKLSHPEPLVREVASIMLDAGSDPVDQAERLVAFVEDERRQMDYEFRQLRREASEAEAELDAIRDRVREFARDQEGAADRLRELL